MTFLGLSTYGYVHDDARSKMTRIALGALYGFLGGTTFAIVASFVDIWLYPDVPLGVDWPLLYMRLPLCALGFALVGAVTSWWSEPWPGLGSGAVLASLLVLGSALYASDANGSAKLIVLIFGLIPVFAFTLPLVWILRLLMEKHLHVIKMDLPALRVSGLFVLILALGSIGGYFTKMSSRDLQVTLFAHDLLQHSLDETSPIHDLQGISKHAELPYKLYEEKADFSTEGFSVRAEYEDGYRIECKIVLYPGMSPSLADCEALP